MKSIIYVVEGRNDASRIKSLVDDAIIITTNGSSIPKETINLLKHYQKDYDILLMLDPDFAGEKIRKTLESELDNPHHVFLERDKAISKNKKKIGIEHASDDDLKELLKNHIRKQEDSLSDIDTLFLYENNLIGNSNSKSLRDKLSKKLMIGHTNGKTLYHRLKKFNITKKEVLEVLSEHNT